MLIHELINFCNSAYQDYGASCGCNTCNHPHGRCSGSCYNCLFQIHYPNSPNTKKVYDCQKMMYHYVCQYSYRYVSEIIYALEAHKDFLFNFKKFNILSIACGACPDLMAFESFCKKNTLNIPIAYCGYDVNPLWKPIHDSISQYCNNYEIRCTLHERDALEHFEKYSIRGANIIIIGYLLSYLYNTNQTSEIDTLFNNIVDHVVSKRHTGDNALIIINDVNSNRRGRDYFSHLARILRNRGLNFQHFPRYFDSPTLNYFQRQGTAYAQSDCLFNVDDNIVSKYHVDAACRSYQLVVEVY